jgi:hypothetical protein
MTPALTAAAITAQVGTAFNAHVANLSNPHQVTAAQVGAYTTSYIDQQFAAVASSYLPINGTAANSQALQGLSPSQLVAQVLSQIPPSTKITYPASTTATAPCWVPIYVQADYTPGTPSLPPIAFYFQGGEAHTDGKNSPTYYVYIDPLYPSKARVECLAGDPGAVSFGYVLNATGGLALYAYVGTQYDQISMLMLSDPLNNFSSSAGVAVSTQPAGYVAISQVITDPTQKLQKPGVGELSFPQSYAQSRVASYFGNGPANNAQSASLVQFLSVATTSGEVTSAQAIQTPWITEWRNMGRTAAYAAEPTYAVNLGSLWAWDNTNSLIEFNSAAQQALCTLLSPEGIPFVLGQTSPYQIEVKLSSTDLGDESIGICFGYIVADGKTFALHAMRPPGGTVVDAVNGTLPGTMSNYGLFTVGLNLFENNGIVIASNTSALTWGDGTAGSVAGHESSYVPQATTSGTNGWANKGTVRIRATYDGAGSFTVETTDFNDTTGAYVSAATLTFTLGSFTAPSGPFAGITGVTIFSGAYGMMKWGLACYKQASSKFGIVTCPDYYGRYVDYVPNADGTDSSALFFYTGNAAVGSSGWESIALSNGPLQPGRLVYSDVNNTLWVVRRDGSVNPLPIIAYTGAAGTQILTT